METFTNYDDDEDPVQGLWRLENEARAQPSVLTDKSLPSHRPSLGTTQPEVSGASIPSLQRG